MNPGTYAPSSAPLVQLEGGSHPSAGRESSARRTWVRTPRSAAAAFAQHFKLVFPLNFQTRVNSEVFSKRLPRGSLVNSDDHDATMAPARPPVSMWMCIGTVAITLHALNASGFGGNTCASHPECCTGENNTKVITDCGTCVQHGCQFTGT